MHLLFHLALVVACVLSLACARDDGPDSEDATPGPSPIAATGTAASPTPGSGASGEVTGLFTEPRPSAPHATVSIGERPRSPFQPWDRESVVLYDIDQMTEQNLGKGYTVSFSPDGSRVAFNPAAGQSGLTGVRVVELATGTSRDYETAGSAAIFVSDNHLFLPGPGTGRVLDIRSGESMPVADVTDPVLKARLDLRAGSGGQLTPDGRYRVQRRLFEASGADPCSGKPDDEHRLCRGEAFERWSVEEVSTGRSVLQLRAYNVVPGAAGELVLATSPQCRGADGALRWCEEVLLEMRRDDPPGANEFEFAEGTTNIFSVDIASGRAEFIATTAFRPNTQLWPANWPLIANQRHIAWTGGFCAPEREGTRVYDRSTRRTTELDGSFWLQFTPKGHLGVDEFGPRAILDIETFEWKIVLPENVVDVVQSPDGRNLAVSGVLGHGGLCG